MKSFAFAATIGAVSAVRPVEFKFMQHLAKFAKSYVEVAEFNARLAFFELAEAEIQESNAAEANFTLGHNQFSDWSAAEYKAILGASPGVEAELRILPETNADEVNWITRGGVNAIKDQGQCGSCWAFSSVAALEGAHFVASGNLLSFSEQQLVDCAYGGNYGSYGCNGGWPSAAMTYYENHDAELESTYPYTSGSDTSTKACQYQQSSATSVEVNQVYSVQTNSVAQMKAALDNQVLSVLVEADRSAW